MVTLNGMISNNWDYALFVLVMLLVLLGMNKFMNKYWQSWRDRRGFRTASVVMAIITAGVLCGGWFFVNNAEKREYESYKRYIGRQCADSGL